MAFSERIIVKKSYEAKSWKAGESFNCLKYFKETQISKWSYEEFRYSLGDSDIIDSEEAYVCNIWYIQGRAYVGRYVRSQCRKHIAKMVRSTKHITLLNFKTNEKTSIVSR